jgi:hypothetical protein
MRPTPQQLQTIARVAKQHPEFVDWLTEIRSQELDSLPYVVNNPQLTQGRCQMVTEIIKLLKDAPSLAAR